MTRRSMLLGIGLLTGSVASCASMVGGTGPYQHPKWGYSLPHPQQLAASETSAWRRTRLAGADLALRGPDGAVMAISSHCDESENDPALLARQLLVGLHNRSRLASERFEFAGGQAYSQIVEAREDDVSVRTRTVTLVRAGCVVDWVLAAPRLLPVVEETFDAWWRGFDPGSMPEPLEARLGASP